MLPAECRQRFAESAVEGDVPVPAAMTLHLRPPPVGRQAEPLRRIIERRAPVGRELFEEATAQALPLPDGVVGVLDRQLRELGPPLFEVRAVEFGKLAIQHPVRRRVVGDVVEDVEQHVLVRAHPEERRPQHQVCSEIEWTPRLFAKPARELPLKPLGRHVGEVNERQR